MATEAQITANRANSQLSTGPVSEAGKQAVSLNNLQDGLAGAFHVLSWEKKEEFEALLLGFRAEYNPETATEHVLVNRLAEHEWLRRRAGHFQSLCTNNDGLVEDSKQFALYLRYQTTHQRAFHKCLHDLLKLRAEKRKQQIGFESQQAKLSRERERAELTQARIRLANAKATDLELDTEIRSYVEARLPGYEAIPFDKLKSVLAVSMEQAFGPGPKINRAA